MKKLILASLSALALFGVAACSDSGTGTDNTQTQSVNPPAPEQPVPGVPRRTNRCRSSRLRQAGARPVARLRHS